METGFYTRERNAQIVISLLKEHGISKVIASPGTTNISLVGSMMNDSFFEIYSAPDERSAAYMACGMAAESGEPVVLSCTGATASRNYIPGLTEAFYRKLPVIAITSALNPVRSGHLFPQFVDRTQQLKDMVKYSAQVLSVETKEDEWACVVKVNEAILETKRNGGGPVHLNLVTKGEHLDFAIKELPKVRKITRYTYQEALPPISAQRIGIFVGSHAPFSEALSNAVDRFCEKYNAIVLCDHTSGYHGKYRLQYSMMAAQKCADEVMKFDLLIHMGEISGDYYILRKLVRTVSAVWRVNEDGQLRDYFKKLTCIFQMDERHFFTQYAQGEFAPETSHYDAAREKLMAVRGQIPELPFSNIWIASILAPKLPENSVMHFGILNSLRAWNFFETPESVRTYCNVGGFGIDGILSTLIGASLVHPEKLYFAAVGDLAFFYDMNSMGNRHVGKNLRILLVNNGKGTEFRNYSHPGNRFGARADEYIAAARHYGNKSSQLVKNYATDLGFSYMTASSKEEFLAQYEQFIAAEVGEHSIVFEVFTNNEDESNALETVNTIIEEPQSPMATLKQSAISIVKKTVGDSAFSSIKRIIKGNK